MFSILGNIGLYFCCVLGRYLRRYGFVFVGWCLFVGEYFNFIFNFLLFLIFLNLFFDDFSFRMGKILWKIIKSIGIEVGEFWFFFRLYDLGRFLIFRVLEVLNINEVV